MARWEGGSEETPGEEREEALSRTRHHAEEEVTPRGEGTGGRQPPPRSPGAGGPNMIWTPARTSK